MSRPNKTYYSCDFETTNDPDDCRVWLWAARDLDSDYKTHGTDIESFMEWALNQTAQLSFHNLKFDGHFILDYLERNGYEWKSPDQKKLGDKQYSTLISDMGMWYTITIGRKGMAQLKIVDSLKLLPFRVEQIAKDFHLPILKGSIDYNKKRPKGWIPTQEEIDYINNDVDIVAMALKAMYDKGMRKLTIGSCALSNCRYDFGKNFTRYFPPPVEYDRDIRQGYRGGWTYCNPIFQGKEIGEGIVLDVNSLYPTQMASEKAILPYGAGVWRKGEIVADKFYPIFIQHLSCQFELKPGYLPMIQIKGDPRFKATDYLTSSHGAIVDLCLTSVDLELFKEHYEIYNVTYHSGWKFKGKGGIFKRYVERWMKEKVEATKAGNYAQRVLAKLMLNSCYGKFATSPNADIRHPFLHDDAIKTAVESQKPKDLIYLPAGMFITAWARYTTIRAAQKVFDRFLYADTDSLHLIGTEIPPELEIDDTKLGAWDHESTFKRAKFLHAKCYIEDTYCKRVPKLDWKGEQELGPDGEPLTELKFTNQRTNETKLKVTVAGLPAACHDNVTWENFGYGASYEGKLKPRVVPGGVVLENIPFEIKRGFIYE